MAMNDSICNSVKGNEKYGIEYLKCCSHNKKLQIVSIQLIQGKVYKGTAKTIR